LLYRQEASADALKNLKSHLFTNPNSSKGGERKVLPLQSPKDNMDTPTDKFTGPNLLHLAHHDSSKTGGSLSQLAAHTSRSGDELVNLMEMHRSQSITDSLGKRKPLKPDVTDTDVYYHDPLYGSKRLNGGSSIENALQSPPLLKINGKNSSGSASPSHSFKGGFKLHSSRKNSGEIDPIGELRASPIILTRKSPT
jgi:hypothetical protein